MEIDSLLVSIFITLIAVRLLTYIIGAWRYRRIVNKIPGPKALPYLGSALEFSKVALEDRLAHLKKLNYQFKDGIVRFWIGPSANVMIRKPWQLEIILRSTTEITKSVFYDYIKIWLGSGLLTSTGQKWSHDRKMITPSFHFKVLEEFAEVMFEKAQILNEVIDKYRIKHPNTPIDIFDYAVRCTLDVICETAMGLNLNCQLEVDNAYGQALYNFSTLTLKRLPRPWLHWNFIYYQTAEGKEFLKAAEIMHNYSNKVIRQKQQERKEKRAAGETESYDDDLDKKKRKALLDLLLDTAESEKKVLTDEELREQVDTFMFAGHDTTAAAISWAVFLLGHHPEIQEKAAKEIEEVLGTSNTQPTHKELANLKYLELVMKETLRLYPSAPQVSRNLMNDTKIDGYTIPKGTTVVIGIFLLHRDPEVWPNPDKFDPERFSPENSKNRHPYAYVPFSAGPRNCIGQKFAMLEFKIVLSSILRKWKIKSARSIDDMKMVSAFILRPHNGIPVYFTPR